MGSAAGITGPGSSAATGGRVAPRIVGFIMLVPASFMNSMSAFVAQNVGAARFDRAGRALAYGISVSAVFNFAMFGISFVGIKSQKDKLLQRRERKEPCNFGLYPVFARLFSNFSTEQNACHSVNYLTGKTIAFPVGTPYPCETAMLAYFYGEIGTIAFSCTLECRASA